MFNASDRLMPVGCEWEPRHKKVVEEALDPDPVDPLTALNRDYSNIPLRARCGVKIEGQEVVRPHCAS
jgi:hypothetical protein